MRRKEPEKSSDYGHVKTIRLRDEDVNRLQALARVLGASEATVIRQALREFAKAQGVE